MEMEIEGLGRLAVGVRDEKKRAWPTGVDTGTADRVAGKSTSGGFGQPAQR